MRDGVILTPPEKILNKFELTLVQKCGSIWPTTLLILIEIPRKPFEFCVFHSLIQDNCISRLLILILGPITRKSRFNMQIYLYTLNTYNVGHIDPQLIFQQFSPLILFCFIVFNWNSLGKIIKQFRVYFTHLKKK